MSHPIYCTATQPKVHGYVYVLTFDASDWKESLVEIDGVELSDPDAPFGVLGTFQTDELAEIVGEAFALQQLKERLDSYPHGETGEARRDALSQEGWQTSEYTMAVIEEYGWRYRLYSGEEDEELKLEMREKSVITHVDGLENEDREYEDQDEHEDSDDDEEHDEEEGDEEEDDEEEDDEQNADGEDGENFGDEEQVDGEDGENFGDEEQVEDED